ncbi:hypothetical protein L7F22_005926 [Adiantum nelumboides]|nr:hypothetical protein [Adiantum nelumboides]
MTAERDKVPRGKLSEVGNSIRETIGWSDPVDFLSIYAYIAKSKAHDAMVEEKRKHDEETLGTSKRATRASNKKEEGTPSKPTPKVDMEDAPKDKKQGKSRGPSYKLKSDIELAIDLKKVFEERILNSKVEMALGDILGIAKCEFHEEIIVIIKRKWQSPIDYEPKAVESQEHSSYPLILGQPYITAVRMKTKVLDDGSAYARIQSRDGKRAVQFLTECVNHARNKDSLRDHPLPKICKEFQENRLVLVPGVILGATVGPHDIEKILGLVSEASSVKSEPSTKKDAPATPTTEQLLEEITKRMQQQMRNPAMRQPKMSKCDICGRNHPTPWCTQQPKAPVVNERVLRWCAIEQKWTNHGIDECFYNKNYVKERPYGPPAGPP